MLIDVLIVYDVLNFVKLFYITLNTLMFALVVPLYLMKQTVFT